MKCTPAVLICFLALLLPVSRARAQNPDKRFRDSLVKKFEYYRAKKREGVLFAHFDKTIYTNNENVWFTAYLLNHSGAEKSDVLSVVLIKDDDRSIVLRKKFVMEKSISVGNLTLADSVAPGDYTFILYTNDITNGQPENYFEQPVTIKNTNDLSFNATLSLTGDGTHEAGKPAAVRLVTSAKGTKIIANAAVSYSIGDPLHPLGSGVVKTDRSGQYIFNVPAAAFALGNNQVKATITFGKEARTVRLVLPADKSLPSVRFYPEGGYLTDGVSSTVGWEVKDKASMPVETRAVLYKDGRPVDTIATDSYGMGAFGLTPSKQSHYQVRLMQRGMKDTVFMLPAAIADGPVISMGNAVANDTVSLFVKTREARSVYVIIHNFKHLFYAFPVKLNAGGRPIKLVLNAIPKGISEITVLDSLKRPCAERLFFAHYDRRNSVNIVTDAKSYKPRQQIALNLDIKDKNGTPLTGLVSVACVQANRMELKKATDIESYLYLNFDLGHLPLRERYMANDPAGMKYLEEVLLIKGWRRYNWVGLENTTVQDTIKKADSMLFTGHVNRYDRPLKKPQLLAIVRDTIASSVTTDAKGDFLLHNTDLYTLTNKQVTIMAGRPGTDSLQNRTDFQIKLNDPYMEVDKLLARQYQPENYGRLSGNGGTANEEMATLQHTIQLKQVEIKAKNDNDVYGAHGANACGDYVCIYNILNCANHVVDSRNKPPERFGHYLKYNADTHKLEPYVYMGCEVQPPELVSKFDGINFAMDFYPADYAAFNPPDPQYLSTIFWKNLYKVNTAGSEPLKFYTGDITGDFKIIVQGVSGNDVVYGEKYFKVSKP